MDKDQIQSAAFDYLMKVVPKAAPKGKVIELDREAIEFKSGELDNRWKASFVLKTPVEYLFLAKYAKYLRKKLQTKYKRKGFAYEPGITSQGMVWRYRLNGLVKGFRCAIELTYVTQDKDGHSIVLSLTQEPIQPSIEMSLCSEPTLG